MKKIALLFGSFNPIHIGHLLIANYISQFTDIDEVGLVLSPLNPLKDPLSLASNEHRLNMCQMAIADLTFGIQLYDLEFRMPRPSYTIDTLRKLHADYPDCEFTLVMGADNLAGIERWMSYKDVLQYPIMVYPRVGFDLQQLASRYQVQAIAAPQIDISSTFIRKAIASGNNIQCYLPAAVDRYIKKNNLYK